QSDVRFRPRCGAPRDRQHVTITSFRENWTPVAFGIVAPLPTSMNVFAGNPLDRAQLELLDDDWLLKSVEDVRSRFLPLWRLDVLVKKDGGGLAWARRGLLAKAGADAVPILLGMRDGVPHY